MSKKSVNYSNMSNPLNIFKTTINDIGNIVSKSYTDLSKNVSKTVSQIIPENIVNNNIEPKINSNIKTQNQAQNEQIQIEPINNYELTPFEKQIQPLYIGCFSDDPNNPSMEKDFGKVSDSKECIELGKNNNYKYVGIQQGNHCFASNNLPISTSVNSNKYCNVSCDNINTGNCGGFFYNQVYKTSAIEQTQNNLNNEIIMEKKKEEVKVDDIIEKFLNIDSDLKKINFGLNNLNCNCIEPINNYIIFIWFIVLIVLLFLLFEYIYKKSENNI